MNLYLAFVALTAVLVLVPGPAVMLVMQQSLSRGFRSASYVALGVLSADLVWATAASLGVTAVLVASEPAFFTLRLMGAAYLIYIGLRLVFARHDATSAPVGELDDAPQQPRHALSFRRGFLCDMTNPKTVIAFTSVIPQFVGVDAHVLMPTLLGVTFAFLGFLSLLLYAALFGRSARVLRRPRLTHRLLRTSGVALVGFGGGLAYDAFKN
jgi:threonine/homoserine/homoserine lactone efflux protein